MRARSTLSLVLGRLSPVLKLEIDTVGAMDKRGKRAKHFPTLVVTAHVQRRAEFWVFNMVLPMGAFVLMSFSTISLPSYFLGDRLAITVTLLLTAAAYKTTIMSHVPPISYNTILDWYVLNCGAIMGLLVVENSAVGWFGIHENDAERKRSAGTPDSGAVGAGDGPATYVEILDWCCYGFLLFLWISLHAWLIRQGALAQQLAANAMPILAAEGGIPIKGPDGLTRQHTTILTQFRNPAVAPKRKRRSSSRPTTGEQDLRQVVSP